MTELWLINILLGALSAGCLMAIKNLYSRLTSMAKDLGELHLTYAKKEDVNRDFSRILDSLKRIEDKLDNKVDK